MTETFTASMDAVSVTPVVDEEEVVDEDLPSLLPPKEEKEKEWEEGKLNSHP